MKSEMNSDDSSGSGTTISSKFNFLKFLFYKKKKSNKSFSDAVAEIVSNDDKEEYQIGNEEKEIIINAVNFTDTKAEDIMIPRSDVVAVPINAKFTDIKKIVIEKGHTRILVYEESLDNIKGFIHIKDLISYFDIKKDFQIKNILRTALFIPPSMKVVDLVLKMRSTAIRIAVVIDEYGGTDGMLTIENLMEEIVGDLDTEEIITLDNNSYEVNAKAKITDIEEKLGIKLVDHKNLDNDFDTLGGLIMSITKRIPEKDDTITHESGIIFYIKEAEARYIKKVIIKTD